MAIEIGEILEGKVTGITKFGAFVELEGGTTGMVHISEIASTFVNEIKDFVQENQTVKVKVLAIGDDGKISLSIKRAAPPAPRPPRPAFTPRPAPQKHDNSTPPAEYRYTPRNNNNSNASAGVSSSFEDMISKFKSSSEEKMSDINRNMNNKRGITRRK